MNTAYEAERQAAKEEKQEMKTRYCKHGNQVAKYVCPDCANDKLAQRQKQADKARFSAQLKRIRGI